jgi:hypothetical protein
MGYAAALAVLLALLQPAPAPMRILFIGNSLTYANDLPGMVCALARSTGRKAVCESVAKPDFGLEEHWRDGEARKAIARGWDVVILQQGPSALRESRLLLIEYAKRFDVEIKKAGARTAFYAVWPSRQRRGDFVAVGQSYAAAAKQVGGVLMPAGDAWRAAWSVDTDLPLYGPDGFHPSPMGSYLAAMVIYRQLLGPVPAVPVLGGAIAEAAVLQRAVEDTVQRLPGQD